MTSAVRGAIRTSSRVLRFVSTASSYGAAASMVLLMLITVADVYWRNVIGGSLTAAIEGSQNALIVVVFLGLGYAMRTGSHVATDLITSRLRFGWALEKLALALLVPYLAWLVVLSFDRAVRAFRTEETFGFVGVPAWPGRAMAVVGFGLLMLEVIASLGRERGARPSDEGPPPQAVV